jgi:hypothetical protein
MINWGFFHSGWWQGTSRPFSPSMSFQAERTPPKPSLLLVYVTYLTTALTLRKLLKRASQSSPRHLKRETSPFASYCLGESPLPPDPLGPFSFVN